MKFLERVKSTHAKKDHTASVINENATETWKNPMLDSTNEAKENHKPLMAKRPNTSAGLRDHNMRHPSTGGDWIKEVSRAATSGPKCSDDLYRAVAMVEITDGLDTFRFPTPSPHMPPRSATFSHSPSLPQYDSPCIGVAIGSPSNAPPNWGRSFTADYINNRVQQPQCRSPTLCLAKDNSDVKMAAQGMKKSSWKAFGDMFRKSSKRSQESFYNCKSGLDDDEISVPTSHSLDIWTLDPLKMPSPALPPGQSVSASRERHTRTSSPDRTASHLEARDQKDWTALVPSLRVKVMRKPGSRGNTAAALPCVDPWRTVEEINKQASTEGVWHDSHLSQQNLTVEAIPSPRTPKLLLDFPTPEFERYSVMFEKLLTNDGKPSLLERRQSRLPMRECVKELAKNEIIESLTINTATGETDRSLTSSHLSRPLFIRVDEERPTNWKIKCSDAAAHQIQQIQRSMALSTIAASPLSAAFTRDRTLTLESSDSQHSDCPSESSLPPTPTTISSCTDTESVDRVLEQEEPAWDMITSKAVKITSPTDQQLPEPYLRVMSPEDLERQIVRVSVAKRVSISRARGRVSRALSSKQPLKPRVVELHKSRKSTAGVLVIAGDEIE